MGRGGSHSIPCGRFSAATSAFIISGAQEEALNLVENILGHEQETDMVLLRGDLLHECGRHAAARGTAARAFFYFAI